MPFFLGFDCGGSSTRALVIDDDETIVFEGKGGSANVSSTPLDTLHQSMAEATNGLREIQSIVGCFAGLLGSESHRTALASLDLVQRGVPKEAYADYMAALAAAPEGTDIVVVSGTGSVVCSWKDGKAVKSGGGGPILGDDGSAFDVGRKAVQNLCLSNLEEPASDRLWAKIMETFGTAERQEIVSLISRSNSVAKDLAQLAPIVGSDFELGYIYARLAVDQAMSGLRNIVQQHSWSHIEDRPMINVAIGGGLWDASPAFQKRFETLLNISNKADQTTAKSRQYHVARLGTPPVMGAARLAKRLFYGN